MPFDVIGYLDMNKDKIFMLIGIAIVVVGLAHIQTYYFSEDAAKYLSVGGGFLILAFLTHIGISRDSTGYEKAFAVTGSLSIAMFIAAIIVYSWVELSYYLMNVAVPRGRLLRDFWTGVFPVINHEFGSLSLVLAATGVVLLLYSLYIKSKYL